MTAPAPPMYDLPTVAAPGVVGARTLERDAPQACCPICGGPVRVRGFKAERATGDIYRYTVCVACDWLLDPSVAVHVTAVVPTRKIAGALFVIAL